MSTQKHTEAKLEGYDGPFFPPALEQYLNLILPANGFKFDRLLSHLSPYRGRDRWITSDDYAWFWWLKFEVKKDEEILIAIPWAQDIRKSDGSPADRAAAVYTSIGVKPEEIDALMSLLLINYRLMSPE